MNKYLREHREAVSEAIEQLWTHSQLTPQNYTIITEYTRELESLKNSLTWLIEDGEGNIPKLQSKLDKVEAELKWFKQNVQIYTNTRVAIHNMHDLVRHMYWKSAECKEFHEDAFFDMKKLVEMINCYYDITEPYKPSNKIAYGWNFAMTKTNFRPYLFGCIRNYLRKNGVEFETSDLQKICCLKDITDEDC